MWPEQPPINTEESWPFPALGHRGEVASPAGPPTPLHPDRLCRPSVLDINIENKQPTLGRKLKIGSLESSFPDFPGQDHTGVAADIGGTRALTPYSPHGEELGEVWVPAREACSYTRLV